MGLQLPDRRSLRHHRQDVGSFVPEIFHSVKIAEICFAHIDLDHYQPTAETAQWCFERLVPGGVIVFDDYFPGRTILATPAIEEFLLRYGGDIEFTRAAGRNVLVAKKNEFIQVPPAH